MMRHSALHRSLHRMIWGAEGSRLSKLSFTKQRRWMKKHDDYTQEQACSFSYHAQHVVFPSNSIFGAHKQWKYLGLRVPQQWMWVVSLPCSLLKQYVVWCSFEVSSGHGSHCENFEIFHWFGFFFSTQYMCGMVFLWSFFGPWESLWIFWLFLFDSMDQVDVTRLHSV